MEVACEGQNNVRQICNRARLVQKKAGAGHHQQDTWLRIRDGSGQAGGRSTEK